MMKQQEPTPGQRIKCIRMMDDPCPIPTGTLGTVKGVTQHYAFGEYHVSVAWDNGRTLSLISSVDKWEIVG